MKKIRFVTILIIALLLPISGNAGKKVVNVINTPPEVNGSNTPMVEVANTDPMAIVVNNISSNPIPVSMRENTGIEILSAYAEIIETCAPYTVMAVPAGKKFVVTDVTSATGRSFAINENEIVKTYLTFNPGGIYRYGIYSVHFNAGIPFSSETNIVISFPHGCSRPYYITIMGYLLENLYPTEL